MPASLGSLVVSLGLDAAEFTDGLTKSQVQARNFVRNTTATFTRLAGTVTILAGAAAAPIAALRALTGEMDDLSKAAQRASMPTEDFTALAYAGGLADVSVEKLQQSMGRLAKAQADAVRVGTSPQAEAFRMLGIELEKADGTLRASSDVFTDFADRFQRFGPTTEVVAAGMQIFGRSFQDLIPLISGGRTGLEEAADEARAFGLVMSTEAGKQAEAFNDNLSRLGLAITGVKRTIAAEALPAFVDLTDALVDTAKALVGADSAFRDMARDGTFRTWAQNTAIAVGTVIESIVFLGKATRAVAGSFETVWADAMFSIDVARLGPGAILFESNRKQLAEALENRNRTLAEANARYRDLWEYNATWITDRLRAEFGASSGSTSTGWEPAVPLPPPPPDRRDGSGLVDTSGVLRDFEDQAERTRQAVANLISNSDVVRAREYGLQVEYLDHLFFDLGLDAQVYDSAMKKLTGATETFGENGRLALQEQADAWLDALDPQREFQRNLEQLQRMLAAGIITPAQAKALEQMFADASRRLTEMDQFAIEAARNIQDHLGNTLYEGMQGNFDDILGSFKRMIDRMVAEALAADLARRLMGDFGKTGQLGGWLGAGLSALFGGGGIGAGTAGSAAATAMVPTGSGGFIPALAGGGPVERGGFYRVNENRTELLSINGKDYLMAGAAGRVRPNPQFAAAATSGGDVHMTVVTPDAESFRRSEPQIVSRLGAGLSRARRFA